MIIILKQGASDAAIAQVEEKLTEHGYQPNVTRGTDDTIIAALGTPHVAEKEVVAPQLQAFDEIGRAHV